MIRKANKEKKWLNNADFLALIKFKKLGTNEKKSTPTLRDDRQHLWFSKYQHIPDPVDSRLGMTPVLEDDDDGDTAVEIVLNWMKILGKLLLSWMGELHMNSRMSDFAVITT